MTYYMYLMAMRGKYYQYLKLRCWCYDRYPEIRVLLNNICTGHHLEQISIWKLNSRPVHSSHCRLSVLFPHSVCFQTVHRCLCPVFYTSWRSLTFHSVWRDSWSSQAGVALSSEPCLSAPSAQLHMKEPSLKFNKKRKRKNDWSWTKLNYLAKTNIITITILLLYLFFLLI